MYYFIPYKMCVIDLQVRGGEIPELAVALFRAAGTLPYLRPAPMSVPRSRNRTIP